MSGSPRRFEILVFQIRKGIQLQEGVITLNESKVHKFFTAATHAELDKANLTGINIKYYTGVSKINCPRTE